MGALSGYSSMSTLTFSGMLYRVEGNRLRHPGIERVSLPLLKVTVTPFQHQGNRFVIMVPVDNLL